MGNFAGWGRRVERAGRAVGTARSAVSKGHSAYGAIRGARSSSLFKPALPVLGRPAGRRMGSLMGGPAGIPGAGPRHGPFKRSPLQGGRNEGLFTGSAGMPRPRPRRGSPLPYRRTPGISPGGGTLPYRTGHGAIPMGPVTISPGGKKLPKRLDQPHHKAIPMGPAARVSPAVRPPAPPPPPKSRYSLRKHADQASAHLLKHKYKYAAGGAAAVGVAGYMSRRGPGTGQSTGGIPTGMYGY